MRQQGDRVRLTVQGGAVEVASSDLISVEPEETFQAVPAPAPAAAGPYGELIRAAAEKHGVDEKLITRLIAAESNFNPKAVSRKQALGLMQLLPKTAAQYSVADVFDPAQNIEGGSPLFEGFAGEISREFAAGPGRLQCRARHGGAVRRNSALRGNSELREANHLGTGQGARQPCPEIAASK